MNGLPVRATRRFLSALILGAVTVAARPSAAATLNVPASHPSIQSAIDAAVNGDTVLVAPGTYLEHLDFKGKAITVVSAGGPEATIIDGSASGSVVTFKNGEPRAAMLSGFTVTNGSSMEGGGGVRIWQSSPTLRGNVITRNQGCTGVGVYSYFSSPLLENNTISSNVVTLCSGAWGVGVYIGGSSNAELIANTIVDNAGQDVSGAGVALFAAGRPLLRSNVIARNSTTLNNGCGWGGGIAIANYIEAIIVNNLIAQNKSCTGGAIHWMGASGIGPTTIVNNTIADNGRTSQPSVYLSGVGSTTRLINNVITDSTGPVLLCQATNWATAPTLDSNDIFSDVQKAYGGSCTDQTGVSNNISVHPAYANPQVADYSIGGTSPLVDAGNNSAAAYVPPTDLAGGPRIASASGVPDRIDIGAYEFSNLRPTANAGVDQTVAADATCVASVSLSGSGADPEGDPLTFSWSGPFGVVTGQSVNVSLPAGVHVITLTVADGEGGRSTDTLTVTVRDVTPPTIGSLTATPGVITKTTHEMVPVTITPSTSDACGGASTCTIILVSSNEPVSGTGGGDLSPDWEITGNLTLRLRAERSQKGSGRVYTITVRCTDASGNSSTSNVTVTVPRK
jgi:serine protease